MPGWNTTPHSAAGLETLDRSTGGQLMLLSITRYSQAEQRPSSGAPTALWTLTLLKSVYMPQKVGLTGKVHSHQNHGHAGLSALREYRKEGQGLSRDLLRCKSFNEQGAGCTYPACHYAHLCRRCHRPHPQFECGRPKGGRPRSPPAQGGEKRTRHA